MGVGNRPLDRNDQGAIPLSASRIADSYVANGDYSAQTNLRRPRRSFPVLPKPGGVAVRRIRELTGVVARCENSLALLLGRSILPVKGRTSGRREPRGSRPPTPPYVRFRIRRFIK